MKVVTSGGEGEIKKYRTGELWEFILRKYLDIEQVVC
jgi:hypothetical protein